jgi:hypothetical protein
MLTRMKIPKTPQDKKRLSLLKDCQNTYGENDKSSRTSIRWRKSWVNRTYRRDVNQSLGEATEDFDQLTDRAKAINRHQWQKCADMPLGEKLLHDKTWEIRELLSDAATADPDFLDKLARYLCAGAASLTENRDLTSGHVAVIIRRVRAVMLDHNSAILDLTWEDLTLLEDFKVS